MAAPPPEPVEDDPDAPVLTQPSIERLDEAVGAGWWQEIIREGRPFPDEVQRLADGFRARLRRFFPEVHSTPIKAAEAHRVPVYHLVFGTRSSEGLLLMNDCMAGAQGRRFFTGLFDQAALSDLILQAADHPMARDDLVLHVVRRAFCQYPGPRIRDRIKQLLNESKLVSVDGKKRIGGGTLISRNPQQSLWST